MSRSAASSTPRVLLLAAADFILAAAAYTVSATCVIEAGADVFLFYEHGLTAIALAAASIVLALHAQDLYTQVRIPSRVALTLQFATAMGAAFLIQALVHYARLAVALPISIMFLGSVLALIVLLAWKLYYFGVISRGFGLQPVLLVCATPLNRELGAGLLAHPELGMKVAGYLDDTLTAGVALEGGAVLGPLAALPDIYSRLQPDRVVADLPAGTLPLHDLVRRAAADGILLEKPRGLYQTVFKRVPLAHLPGEDLIFGNELSPPPSRVAAQAVYTNTLALAALVLLAPVMALVALAVAITSGRPVIERTPVIGWQRTPFLLARFRCTRVGRTAHGGEILELTPIGRWLKRFCLDALPQLFNIVRGEMALVGPRPVRTEFASVLLERLPYYHLRHSVKPGLVGWAEVNLWPKIDDVDITRELEFDFYYINHVSPALDCYILLHSLGHLLRRPASQSVSSVKVR